RLMAACGRHPVLIHLLDNDELAPDLGALERVVDAETGETFCLRGDRAAREVYQRELERWLDEIDAGCRRLGITYLRPDARQSAEAFVRGGLHRAGVVEHASGGHR